MPQAKWNPSLAGGRRAPAAWNPALAGGKVSTGPHHSVHGIGGFFHNLAQGAEDTARGFGPGIANAGEAAYENFRHPLRDQNLSWNKKSNKKSPFEKRVSDPLIKAYKEKYVKPLEHGDFGKLGSNVYADPFGTGLDVATLLTGGAGAVGRGGALAGKLGVVSDESRLARLGEARDITVPNPAKRLGERGERAFDLPVRRSSANPLIRGRQMAVNKLFNKLPAGTPAVGSEARFARAIGRVHSRAGKALALKGEAFAHAFASLNKNERVVWHLHARAADPEMWAKLLEDGAIKHPKGTEAATIKRLDEPKVRKLYANPNGKITNALEHGRELSDLMTAEKVSRGYLDELTAAESPYQTARRLHGAEDVSKEAQVTGEPSARTLAREAHVKTLQGEYDRHAARVEKTQSKLISDEAKKYLPEEMGGTPLRPAPERVRPRTVEEAQARFAELDRQYEAFMKGIEQKIGHPAGLSEKEQRVQAMNIGKENAKARLQQSGKTRSGRVSSAKGTYKREIRKLPRQEVREHAEAYVEDAIKRFGDNPEMQRLAQLRDEHEALREQLARYQEQKLGSMEGDEPVDFGTTKLPPKERVRLKPRKGELGTPEDFAAQALGNKVLTFDQRLLTPKGGAILENKGAALSDAKRRLELSRASDARRLARKGGVKLQGIHDTEGNSLEELAHRLADEGRMQPFHVPDESAKKRPLFSFNRPGAGPPPKMASSRQNLGILLRKGMINLHGDSLSGEFRRFARHVARSDVHSALLESAAKVPETGVPEGWRLLLQSSGQTGLPYTAKTAGELKAAIKGGESKQELLNRFTAKPGELTDDTPLAVDGEGHHLMIPDNVARVLTQGATSERGLVRHIAADKPLAVWKHLVLGLRPAYMANIILSQHILGLLQAAPDGHGIYSYINHLIPGARMGKLTDRTVAEYLPEQAHGSFAQSVGGHSTKGARALSKAYEGVMPATLRVENWLRRLMVEGWANSDPVFQSVLARNGGDINAAFAEVAKTHPHVIDEISQKVDHAQGNYRDYSPTEQKFRAIVPFYGWDRHIVQSTYRMLAEHPGRTAAAAALGQQGHQINERDFGLLPTYLRDLVKISPMDRLFGPSAGRVTGLSTHAIGPFESDADIAGTLSSLAHGRAGTHTEEASNLNPLFSGMIEQLTGRSLLTGAPLPDKLSHGVLNVPLRVALQTPQARLAEEYLNVHPLGKRKSSPASLTSFQLQLAALLGIPVKRLDLAHEHQIAGLQGQGPK
jgi:hypothetical protein